MAGCTPKATSHSLRIPMQLLKVYYNHFVHAGAEPAAADKEISRNQQAGRVALDRVSIRTAGRTRRAPSITDNKADLAASAMRKSPLLAKGAEDRKMPANL